MIAAREWIWPRDRVAAPLYNETMKPPVAVSILPHPRTLGYLVLVDEDRHIVAALDLVDAVAMGWVVTTDSG